MSELDIVIQELVESVMDYEEYLKYVCMNYDEYLQPIFFITEDDFNRRSNEFN